MALGQGNGTAKAILVKVSTETHGELKKLADRERRAMAHQAAIAIEEHLARERETAGKA
jgi:predicted transcriptional regulator